MGSFSVSDYSIRQGTETTRESCPCFLSRNGFFHQVFLIRIPEKFQRFLMIVKQKTAWKEAAWIFGLSRLMILLLSYLAVTFLSIFPPPNSPGMYIGPEKCINNIACFLLSWWRWDAVHYVQIAYSGYSQRLLTVFFPFFPLLMRSVGFLLGGSVIADYAAGLILANSCFYGVLVLFYHLVSKDFGQRVAKYALIYLAFAPYAIFFFVGYTESLFLLLTLAFFLFLRRGKPLDWWLAGLCGFLAALTRPTGIILVIPFLSLFMEKFDIHTGATPKGCTVNRARWRQKLTALLPIILIPAGLLIYLLYQWRAFGNPWLFTVEEVHVWHRSLSFPWVGFFTAIREVATKGQPLSRWSLSDIIFTLIPL